MPQPARRLDDLPTEFPIFPLAGALLLPWGVLPLNIFEPRYLAMTDDVLAGPRVLGMIQPEHEAGEGLYRTGCLGRLTSFEETGDGRYLIALSGLIRFRVEAELEMRRGYRRVRAALAPFADDLAPPAVPGLDRAGLLAALVAYAGRRGFPVKREAVERMEDDALVVTLCMACPFAPAEKQALLEAPDPAARAGVLRALLEMAAHETAAPATLRRTS